MIMRTNDTTGCKTPKLFYPFDFLLLKLLKAHNEATQTILRQRNFSNQVSICAKDRKAFNKQIFQQLEPKMIFSSLSR